MYDMWKQIIHYNQLRLHQFTWHSEKVNNAFDKEDISQYLNDVQIYMYLPWPSDYTY